MSNFSDRLKELRTEKGILQRELADYLKVSRVTITQYETGNRSPDDEIKKKIAEYFNVSLDYLMGASDIRNPYQDKVIKKDEPTFPDEFSTPEEAVKFLLEQNVIMGFGGFDIDKLSDEEKVEFANLLLEHLKLLSYKYKK
ncbi:helix-turn-helix domain-containing protein [Tissierella carlieri]|uniref:Helix-turn-helix domain-containing protein n=1 Tax=Tissierella carlieri TaxID=689904 RepID=A0ABT1S4X9_9FIRM|nr:helix-turn-helix transcriptional regulator [Tissierella carlieri]MCQ4921515.1 helix-turn-helix domain-containing protein [Tissierella carlieri]